MASRKEAEELLQRICSCVSKRFWRMVDESMQGVGFILGYLEKAGGEAIAGDLARELNVSTARIAALLKKMEKNELIVRFRSSTDARQTVVNLTRKGAECAKQAKEQVLAKMELLLEKVGREELDKFIEISLHIRKALEEKKEEE